MSHAAAASPPGERAHGAGWSAATVLCCAWLRTEVGCQCRPRTVRKTDTSTVSTSTTTQSTEQTRNLGWAFEGVGPLKPNYGPSLPYINIQGPCPSSTLLYAPIGLLYSRDVYYCIYCTHYTTTQSQPVDSFYIEHPAFFPADGDRSADRDRLLPGVWVSRLSYVQRLLCRVRSSRSSPRYTVSRRPWPSTGPRRGTRVHTRGSSCGACWGCSRCCP